MPPNIWNDLDQSEKKIVYSVQRAVAAEAVAAAASVAVAVAVVVVVEIITAAVDIMAVAEVAVAITTTMAIIITMATMAMVIIITMTGMSMKPHPMEVRTTIRMIRILEIRKSLKLNQSPTIIMEIKRRSGWQCLWQGCVPQRMKIPLELKN